MLGFKIDSYKQSRGKYSRFLSICCDNCSGLVCYYQKDGPGKLKRLYLDRIIFPKKLAELKNLPLNKISNLNCPHCKRWLAIPYIYPTEKRLAYRIFEGEIQHSIINKTKLSKIAQ